MLLDLKTKIENTEIRLNEILSHINISDLKEKQSRLENKSSDPSLWNDPQSAQKILQELKNVSDQISLVQSLETRVRDIKTLIELSVSEEDSSMEQQIKTDIDDLKTKIEELEFSTIFRNPSDLANAILSINAGAGGTDAQDWAEILLRMYSRWAENKNFGIELADISYGEQAGIKSVVIFVKGQYAYGYLKSETGIHRLVRMSPFNADGKRHTSFAAVEVIPEIGEELEVEIKPDDLRIDTFRSSGPGGQNVQKVESAIRITHIPTGIVAQSQTDRSQHKNKDIAMKLLRARLKDRMDQEHKDKLEELRGVQKDIGWGNQIRSYVFAPYQMVKDHRTNVESGNVEKVINGDIDPFIHAYLKYGNIKPNEK